MAELFAAVSGGAGLVSLALQLGDSAVKIKRLYSSAKQAPETLSNLSFELETFSLLLREVERSRQTSDDTSAAVIVRCIQMCENGVRTIRTTVDKLEILVLKSPRFGKFRTAIEEKELGQLCDTLERAKTSLMLAVNLYSEAQRRRDSELIHASHVIALQQFSIAQEQHALLTDRNAIVTTPMTISANIDHQRATRTRRLRKPAWRLGIRFRPWFLSSLWQLSVQRSRAGWNIQLWTANTVPRHARIFRLCLRGDLIGVQELFQQGLASPLDRTPYGHTALEAAAWSGNVELCDFLMQSHEAMALQTDGLKEAIHALIGESFRFVDMEESIEMYRFLVKYLDFDSEDLLKEEWWQYCPYPSSLRIVQDNLAVPYQALPWSVRFEHAMALQDWMHSTAMFLQPLACSPSDVRLATSITSDGSTILHAIAGAVFWSHIKENELQKWKDMVSAFIVNGGQLHHLNNEGKTALGSGLQRGRLTSANTQLQVWVRLLQDIGVDLNAYGQLERKLWRPRELWREIAIDWEFGSLVHDWVALVSRVAYVPVYKLQKIPGAWHITDYTSPRVLPWTPIAEDEPPKDSLWYLDCEVRLESAQSPNAIASRGSDLYCTLLTGTQDDASEVLQLVRATQRPRLRPRSSSQPHLLQRGQNESGNQWHYVNQLLDYYHFCPHDSRRRLLADGWGIGDAQRRCMRGIGHNINIEKGIMRRLRNFRKQFTSRAELDTLEEEDYTEHGFGPWTLWF